MKTYKRFSGVCPFPRGAKIDSISFNPDALAKGIRNILIAEGKEKKVRAMAHI